MAVLLTMAVQAQKQIEVQDLVSGKFNAYGVSDVTPMADGQHYLTQEGPYILKYSFKGGDTPDTILNIRKVKGESLSGFSDFILSPTEDMILLETNRQKIFRRSSTANWYIYSIKNNRIDPLSNGGPQQVPLFSPDGHQIAFVRDNNIYLVKLLCPHMSDMASVVNISSSRDRMSQPQTESYTAAKGGIAALTHALAVSLAGKARVNSISPGWIDTAYTVYEGPDATQQPAGRVGNPLDIANMVLYLCSDKAGFITGENICIDGGMTRQMIYHNDFGWTLQGEIRYR